MLTTIYDNNELSPELNEFLTELKPEVDKYTTSKAQAQRSRMLIIGRCNDYKKSFPQRSADHRLLQNAMRSEWTEDVIKKAVAAYDEYNRLIDTEVCMYVSLAETATPSQLVVLNRGTDTTLAYDAARYLNKTGELPSKGRMEQYLSGYVKADFIQPKRVLDEPSSHLGADTQIDDNPQKCPGALLTTEPSNQTPMPTSDFDRLTAVMQQN